MRATECEAVVLHRNYPVTKQMQQHSARLCKKNNNKYIAIFL